MKTGGLIKLRLGRKKKWQIQRFSEKRKRSIDSRGNVVMSMEIGGDLQQRLMFWAMVLMKSDEETRVYNPNCSRHNRDE